MNHTDPNDYFQNLQALANEQDRAKLQTLALEFGSVLQRLPKLQSEMQAFLAPHQALDYVGLVQRLEPALMEAANFLDDVDFLPTSLKQHETVQAFLSTALNTMSFRTVSSVIQRFQEVCEESKSEKPKSAPIVKASWQKQGKDQYGQYGDLSFNGVIQRFRWIPASSFIMGSPKSEKERLDSETQHRVNIRTGFWLADTACTQALWQAVMGSNPAHFNGCLDHPVEQVSWHDVQLFLQRASEFLEGLVLRLPSEAEWEYACRAGTTGAFWFSGFWIGDRITPQQANYDARTLYAGLGRTGEYRQSTVVVKSFAPNPWGLYQMHGNVWEWCDDYWDDYANTPRDGSSARNGDGGRRVLRGGSWCDKPNWLRSASRFSSDSGRLSFIGFRLVCTPILGK